MAEIKTYIKRHEGKKLMAYTCSAGFLTIGYGRNLDANGISEAEADMLLSNDITRAIRELTALFQEQGFASFSEMRQIALIDMVFNLGISRFKRFNKMIAAIKAGDWAFAAKEALESKWAMQVGARAVEDAKMLKEG